MGIAMMRTSYSPMFNEALDFTCVIFDGKGEMIAQAEFCPAHIGAVVHTVEWAIKEIGPENMQPGDVFLHNDPYRGGCHLPEFMSRPDDGRLHIVEPGIGDQCSKGAEGSWIHRHDYFPNM
ncbi:MAG: hydantoinase B/oxoprolinase family protein [Chloroflexi bacterium]|nr:hydantoinase B/oxoprolinase family protein [Chloroflexota bacterium]